MILVTVAAQPIALNLVFVRNKICELIFLFSGFENLFEDPFEIFFLTFLKRTDFMEVHSSIYFAESQTLTVSILPSQFVEPNLFRRKPDRPLLHPYACCWRSYVKGFDTLGCLIN